MSKKPKTVSVRTRHGTELLEPKADPCGASQAEIHRERVLRMMRYDRAQMAARLETGRPAPLIWEDLPVVRPAGQPMATPKEENPVPPASADACAAMAERVVIAALAGTAVALALCAAWMVWR